MTERGCQQNDRTLARCFSHWFDAARLSKMSLRAIFTEVMRGHLLNTQSEVIRAIWCAGNALHHIPR